MLQIKQSQLDYQYQPSTITDQYTMMLHNDATMMLYTMQYTMINQNGQYAINCI